MHEFNKDKLVGILVWFLIVASFTSFVLLAYLAYKKSEKPLDNSVFSGSNLSTISRIPQSLPVEPIDTTPLAVEEKPATYNMRVLTVNYNPIENSENTAEKYFKFAMGNRNARELENYAYNQVIQSFKILSNNRINYSIVKQIDINEFPTYPDGFKFDINSYSRCVWGSEDFNAEYCEQRKVQFDYVKWAKDYKICETAEANNVDEIWVMGLPYVMAYESFMIGPNEGFWVNGPSYTVDTCKKHYIAINPVYDSPDLFMHDIGHRVEATMTYLTSIWSNEDREKYWVNFAKWDDQKTVTSNTCGNTHFPVNATQDYDFTKKEVVSSSCNDWKNFPDLRSERINIGCDAWGCTDKGWQTYWMGSLPSSAGEATMTSKYGRQFKFKKDWWHYLLYPENAIKFMKDNS